MSWLMAPLPLEHGQKQPCLSLGREGMTFAWFGNKRKRGKERITRRQTNEHPVSMSVARANHLFQLRYLVN
jgi:hypothetical protein